VDHALVANLTLPQDRSDSSRIDFYRRLDANLRGVPGIRAAGVGTTTPLSNNFFGIGFAIPGRPPEPNGRPLAGIAQAVTPRYLEATGVRVLDGRGIDDRDARGSQRVVVINKYMADAFWPRRSAINQLEDRRLHVDGGRCRVERSSRGPR
jgi:hypothetical protein